MKRVCDTCGKSFRKESRFQVICNDCGEYNKKKALKVLDKIENTLSCMSDWAMDLMITNGYETYKLIKEAETCVSKARKFIEKTSFKSVGLRK